MSTTPAATTTTTTTAKFNVLAIVGFVLSFFVSIVGAIIGAIALVQIGRRGERGRGLAIAAIIIGIVVFVLNLVFLNAAMHMTVR